MYGKFEQIGYIIPDKSIKNIEIRVDNSIGIGFSNYIKKKYPNLNEKEIFSFYKHKLPEGFPVDVRQYKNDFLADFIEYVEVEWIPNKAPNYLKERAPESLPYLEKVIAKLPPPNKELE